MNCCPRSSLNSFNARYRTIRARPKIPVGTFDEYTPKLKHSTYGTDEYKGFLAGMGAGLEHHYAHNRHHPEHHAGGVHGMNLVDLIEMLADWKAAGNVTRTGA